MESVKDLEETVYGFRWGPAKVERFFSDGKKGWITVGITTAKADIQIYVTKTGKLRIHDFNGEWTPPPKPKGKR